MIKSLELKLIYSASKDGQNYTNCHSKCNNVPNTFSLITTKKGNKFGFFRSIAIDGQGPWKIDNNAFFLSFDKNKIYRYICGYSLSALFALWVFFSDKNKNDKIFDGAGACSPSLWFIKWDEYMKERYAPEESILYMSLGDKEGFTKNETFKKMRTGMEQMIEKVKNDKNLKKYKYEENKGGHYTDCEMRIAKSFKWLIEN